MKVITEKDQATLEALRKMGKLKGQGYLYGQPETAEQVRQRLAAQGKLNGESDPAQDPTDAPLKQVNLDERPSASQARNSQAPTSPDFDVIETSDYEMHRVRLPKSGPL